jgi:hypothetical protein
MKKCLLATAMACLALSGCVVVDITKTAKGFYQPTNANDIEILKTRPDRKFVELGTVTVTGYDASSTAKMHNAIRSKAAPLGANAVYLTDEVFTQGAFGAVNRWATGVAIKFE